MYSRKQEGMETKIKVVVKHWWKCGLSVTLHILNSFYTHDLCRSRAVTMLALLESCYVIFFYEKTGFCVCGLQGDFLCLDAVRASLFSSTCSRLEYKDCCFQNKSFDLLLNTSYLQMKPPTLQGSK